MLSEAMDSVFQAMAHADRRRILDVVRATPGCSVNDVSGHFSTSRIAVMKHLRLLEEAGLLTSEKVGRTRRLYVNPVPIQMIYDRWVSGYVQFWAEKVLDIKYAVEGAPPESKGEAGTSATKQGEASVTRRSKGKSHGKRNYN